MNDNHKTMNGKETEKSMYGVPEGYFASLRTRLSEIPSQVQSVTPWMRVRPYLAMAAAFLLLVTGGTLLLRLTAVPPAEEGYEIASLIPVTDPESVFSGAVEALPEPTHDDIVEYLIDTDTSLELLAYTNYHENNR